jgi:ubiquinone/menaquinone biosynthesis C-methylase UbiE
MDHHEAGRLWNENAETWTRLSRAGYDVFRDLVNSPAFFRMLPEVRGLRGLDVGCGEGTNTRALARRGARITDAIDAETFMRHAASSERDEPLGIRFARASGQALPFAASSFDFTTGFMSFMDMPDHPALLGETHRVLRRGGFLQFSISHP